MNKYVIRFNQQHNESELCWKVFEKDAMFLAKDVIIKVPSFTERSHEDPPHWNIVCFGQLNWSGNIVIITES